MPPKTRRFLGIIYEKAYRNAVDDFFVVFEESDFVKAGFPVGEIEELLEHLKRERILADWGTYPVSRDVKHLPLMRKEKESRLRPSFWQSFLQSFFAGEKSKDRYVLKLVSRDAFYAFYKNPSGQSVPPITSVVPMAKNKKFPADLQWSELTIQFLNGEEAIVKYRSILFQTTADEMGFLDKKTKSPNSQWQLMLQLASHGGELTWNNNSDLSQNDKDSMKKRKQLLVQGLQKYFGISGDPFLPYRENKAYRIKIKLVPENIELGRDDNLGIKDYYKAQTPSVRDAGEFTE